MLGPTSPCSPGIPWVQESPLYSMLESSAVNCASHKLDLFSTMQQKRFQTPQKPSLTLLHVCQDWYGRSISAGSAKPCTQCSCPKSPGRQEGCVLGCGCLEVEAP